MTALLFGDSHEYESIPTNAASSGQRSIIRGPYRKWTIVAVVVALVLSVVVVYHVVTDNSSSNVSTKNSLSIAPSSVELAPHGETSETPVRPLDHNGPEDASLPGNNTTKESIDELSLEDLHRVMYAQIAEMMGETDVFSSHSPSDAPSTPMLIDKPGRGKRNRESKKTRDGPAISSSDFRKRVMKHSSNPFIQKEEEEHSQKDSVDFSDFWLRESSPGVAKVHGSHPGDDDPELREAIRIFHLSDPHVDPFFSPLMTMQPGVCHSCRLSTAVFGPDAFCPLLVPDTVTTTSSQTTWAPTGGSASRHALLGYAFGRFRCNPPPRLMQSLLGFLQEHNPNPDAFIVTGDLAPHGYPDDNFPVDEHTKLDELCPTKYIVFKRHLKELRTAFPDTPFAFTMGNNDHLPKNTFWPPYIRKIAGVLIRTGFLDPRQRASFEECGAHYVDLERDALRLRVLLPDMTLFTPGGEATFPPPPAPGLSGAALEDALYPARAAVVRWLETTLASARADGRVCVLAVHQPLQLKKGREELLMATAHGRQFKALLAEYADILVVALAGHRNLAGLGVVRGPAGTPIVASVTVPGVSPRANNNPSFNELFLSPRDGKVLEVRQFAFDLIEENEMAMLRARAIQAQLPASTSADTVAAAVAALGTYAPLGKRNIVKDPVKVSAAGNTTHNDLYLGSWQQEGRGVWSWRALSGARVLDARSVEATLTSVQLDSGRFVALQAWKQAGFAGQETPENIRCGALHDEEEAMMRCLFPEQDERCFSSAWLR